MNLLQLGLSFFDEKGTPAPKCSSWQINFHFNQSTDTYSSELLQSTGIDLWRNKDDGVSHERFASLLSASGLVLNDDTTWITFNAYVFAFLSKPLPSCRNQIINDTFQQIRLVTR